MHIYAFCQHKSIAAEWSHYLIWVEIPLQLNHSYIRMTPTQRARKYTNPILMCTWMWTCYHTYLVATFCSTTVYPNWQSHIIYALNGVLRDNMWYLMPLQTKLNRIFHSKFLYVQFELNFFSIESDLTSTCYFPSTIIRFIWSGNKQTDKNEELETSAQKVNKWTTLSLAHTHLRQRKPFTWKNSHIFELLATDICALCNVHIFSIKIR